MPKSMLEIGRELKKDLILKDFEAYVNGITRHQERAVTLRQWEVTLLVASYGFALGQGLMNKLLPIVAAILIMFGLIEAVINGRIRRRERILDQAVRAIASEEDLSQLLTAYVFEHTRWISVGWREKANSFLSSLVKPDFLVWKTALAIVSLAVYFMFS